MRRKPLRADPAKVREFVERGRQPLKRTALSRGGTPLRPGERKGGAKGRPVAPRAAERPTAPAGPLSPSEWRNAVWALDHGRCVMCGKQVRRDADRWSWQCHHPLEKHKLPAERRYDPRNGVVTCRRCHERHTCRIVVIPASRLPARVFAFAAELGERWLAVLERAHPQEPGGGDAAAHNDGRSGPDGR